MIEPGRGSSGVLARSEPTSDFDPTADRGPGSIMAMHAGTHERRYVQNPADAYGIGLSFRQARCVAEFVIHGNAGDAADCMGISPQTFKNHCSSVNIRLGARSTAQAAYLLGWLRVPGFILRAEGAQRMTPHSEARA